MPYLSKILIYPIKALDGIELTEATLLPGGAIAHDREFALFDHDGNFVHGKRTEKIHAIRSTYDLSQRTITLWLEGNDERQTYHLDSDRRLLEDWFSAWLGYPVTLQQNLQIGFPDDTNASGPTVVSVRSLETVAEWLSLSVNETRKRFRANLEIDDVPAFWEDQLVGDADQVVQFQLGKVRLRGSNPCQRCIVPTRNPITGEQSAGFQKLFSEKRRETLPDWAPKSWFNHFYKLTTNTKLVSLEAGNTLKLGDELVILGNKT